MSKAMEKRIHAALHDKRIHDAFQTWEPILKFISMAAGMGIDYEAARGKIHAVKERCINELPQLVEQFKRAAVEAGAQIYEAKTGQDANDYILKVARDNGVKSIVKSTSSLAREIGCREALEKVGLEVTETDVGDWIIQLANEKPMHMTATSCHITIEQVTELLSSASGEKLQPEPQCLLDATRKTLRKAFIRADMGISGANIAVAESGTIVILTNEGNECMVTTMPRLHVALVGIEKLVSTLEDATVILRLLSRANMGMKLPVYISHISGPSIADSSPAALGTTGQGPAELHIVLVDSGRSSLRQSAEFREALYCIKCGACINVCPVFRSLGGQTYGHIYQGGIGTVLTAFLNDFEIASDLASLCMGCKACTAVCPAGIDIPGMITRLRAKIVAEKGLSWTKKMAYRSILCNPGRFDNAVRAAAFPQRPFLDNDGMLRRLPPPFASLTNTISLPPIAYRTLHDRLEDFVKPREAKAKVAFYAGCVCNYVYPELGMDVINILGRYDAQPYFPPGQTCCGAPAFYEGVTDTAVSLAKKNIAALEVENPDYIVTVCPGCAAMLQKEYPRLLGNDLGWKQRAGKVAGKIRDFSQLVTELSPSAGKKAARNVKLTYHDPCHLRRGLGIYREPRQLLEREGYEIVEMEDSDVCCGFGGKTVLEYPELSDSVLQRKLDKIIATGVDTVVTNCTACVLQLRGGLDKRKSLIKVMHSAELMAGENKQLPPKTGD